MKDLYNYLNNVSTFEEFPEETLTKEERDMIKKAVFGKKKFSVKKAFTVTAAAALIAAVGITSYATGFIDNIIKTVTTGHNQYSVYSSTPEYDGMDMPVELRGLLYNADGSEADRFFPDAEYFDKDGNAIDDLAKYVKSNGIDTLTTEDGVYEVELAVDDDDALDPIERHIKQGGLVANTIDELNGKLDFTPAVPSVIPEGFTFRGGAYYEGSGEYLFLYYTNAEGEYFFVHERVINDETAYEDGAKEIEELTINGHNAVLLDGRSLDWEADGISVSIGGRGLLDRSTMIAMAESMYK